MTYTCTIQGDTVFAFLDGKLAAKFDTDTFLTNVISPIEFKRFERNPDKNRFDIRKLELNLYKL
jgi:hypothetical protein